MSFSFSTTAASKAEAQAKVAEQMAAVVVAQPVHARDQPTVIAAASASIDTLVEPVEGECVYVSVAGYLTWRGEGEFIGASVSISAMVRTAE